jgi:ElaB/YqjD/DUF883 family membrane-anchored ribosome-binding protein
MADTADDITANLEKQIADLRKEMTKMGKSVRARASDAVGDVEEVYEDARGRSLEVARHVRDGAHHAGDIARDNPGTAASIFTVGAVVGLAAGLLLGSLSEHSRRR